MRKKILLSALGAMCSLALAQGGAQRGNEANAAPQAASMRAVIPVFSQLVAFSYPKGFAPAFEDSKNGNYIQESVPRGETIQRWSQMVTVTGVKGLAANPEATLIGFVQDMALLYRDACPDSFMGKKLGEFTLNGHDALASVISCGSVKDAGGARSESALVIVIKGQRDYYTLQWAERGKASRGGLPLDSDKWTERLRQLGPLALCPRVPGEAAPYPSCLGLS